jgi:hypothetical protein
LYEIKECEILIKQKIFSSKEQKCVKVTLKICILNNEVCLRNHLQ